MLDSFKKVVEIIEKIPEFIRAMNDIIASKSEAFVSSLYSESPDYFTLRLFENQNTKIVCSEPYPLIKDWKSIENNSFTVI